MKTAVTRGDREIMIEGEGGISQLLTKLQPRSAQPQVIAIDGRCAAGKTTLAKRLSEELAAPVIHMDDFFLPTELRTAERLAVPGGNVHYERFAREVLSFLRQGQGGSYQKFDCSQRRLTEWIAIPKAHFTIVEGAYSCHPALGEYMDVRVFLDVEKDRQRKRIQSRNGRERWQLFQTKWIPLEEAYFQAYPIKEHADVVVWCKE